jgi:high-affinity iron transporter
MPALRRLAIVGGLAFALLWVPNSALAQDVTPSEAINELAVARRLLDRSLELYEGGRVDEAFVAARNSYLDHFEYVEIPLRIRDEGLTLAVEEDYATFRGLIEAQAPIGDIEEVAVEIRSGLDEVERTLSEPGLAAPILAFGYAFTILFREGLEAVLIVAAILGYLEASRNTQYRGPILKGVAAAGGATIVTFLIAMAVIELAPVQRELIEAGTALLAVAVLFYVSFWLITRLEQRRWMEFVKAKVWTAATTGSALALAGVGFTAVYREGFETVLFYQSLVSFATGLLGYVAAGTAAAAIALGAVGWFIFRAGRRVPIKAFLGTAVVLVMVLSVAFVGNAVRGFQEAAMFPVTFIESLPRLPIFVAQLTGWYPTRETIIAQAALTSIYVLGGLWTFVVLPRRERGVSAGREVAEIDVRENVPVGEDRATTGN